MDGKAARDCATCLRAKQGSARGPGRSARAAAHTPLPGAGAGRLAPGRCSLSLVSDPPGDRTGPAMNHAACPAERGGNKEKIRSSHAVDGIGMAMGAAHELALCDIYFSLEDRVVFLVFRCLQKISEIIWS